MRLVHGVPRFHRARSIQFNVSAFTARLKNPLSESLVSGIHDSTLPAMAHHGSLFLTGRQTSADLVSDLLLKLCYQVSRPLGGDR